MLVFYKPITLDEKFKLLQDWLQEFVHLQNNEMNLSLIDNNLLCLLDKKS